MKDIKGKFLGKFLRAEDLIRQVYRLRYLHLPDKLIAKVLDIPVKSVEMALTHPEPTKVKPNIYHDRYVIATMSAFPFNVKVQDVIAKIDGEYIHGALMQHSDFQSIIERISDMGGDYGPIMVYRLIPVVGGTNEHCTII